MNKNSLKSAQDDWVEEDELTEETQVKLEGLKTMARWLLGLKQDANSAGKTYRIINAIMENKGDLTTNGKILNLLKLETAQPKMGSCWLSE